MLIKMYICQLVEIKLKVHEHISFLSICMSMEYVFTKFSLITKQIKEEKKKKKEKEKGKHNCLLLSYFFGISNFIDK